MQHGSRTFWVYILASQPRGTLYIGVTNDILGRVEAHRNGKGSVFTSKYRIGMLVYYEEHSDIRLAIQREKTLKHYVRDWKINLIERENPKWVDLYPELVLMRGGKIDPAWVPMDPRDKPEDDI